MQKHLLKSIGIILFFLITYNANAKKWYVNDGSQTGDIYCTAIGAAGNSGLIPSKPMATLGAAIAAASAGDTIYVDAGTWGATGTYTAINININKAVKIIGAGTGNTIFNDNGGDHIFANITSSNVIISDITFTGYANDSQSTSGQVININGAYTGILLENIVITNCRGTSTTLPNITIQSGASVTIKNLFSKCSGYDALQGGGIYVNGSTLNLINSSFFQNQNWFENGGALEIKGSSNVTVTNCTFSQCESNDGGAIYMTGGKLSVSGSCFDSNSSESDYSGDGGGAVYVYGTCTTNFLNCTFTNNLCTNDNLASNSASGCGLYLSGTIALSINTCSFSGNGVALGFKSGQDIYVASSGITGTITNCTFATAKSGKQNIYNNGDPAANISITYSETYSNGGTVFNHDNNSPTSTAITNCINLSNVIDCSATVNCATETTAPIIFSCAPDTTLAGACSTALPDFRPLVTVYDACSVTLTQSPVPGTIITGVNTVTITATNQVPLSSSCTFTVTTGSGSVTAPIIGTITQPTCTLATGSVALSGLPASGTWTVMASPGNSITTGSGTTTTFSGLAVNTYTFTVTDNNGCTSTAS